MNAKKTYYCAAVNVFDYGAVKTAVIERTCKSIPENRTNKIPGMTSYMDWFESRELAEAFLAKKAAA